MNIFNRKELGIYSTQKEQSEVSSILEKSNIDFEVKVMPISDSSFFSESARGKFGSFGENSTYSNQYVFYVNKKDYDYAKKILRSEL